MNGKLPEIERLTIQRTGFKKIDIEKEIWKRKRLNSLTGKIQKC